MLFSMIKTGNVMGVLCVLFPALMWRLKWKSEPQFTGSRGRGSGFTLTPDP